MENMQFLMEQLQSNNEALNRLKERRYDAGNSTFWIMFRTSSQRGVELNWIDKIEKRVLGMRHTILENIRIETVKGMYHISNELRSLNLKVA
jgi:hypothetical protein